jgi:hypothetical protein
MRPVLPDMRKQQVRPVADRRLPPGAAARAKRKIADDARWLIGPVAPQFRAEGWHPLPWVRSALGGNSIRHSDPSAIGWRAAPAQINRRFRQNPLYRPPCTPYP